MHHGSTSPRKRAVPLSAHAERDHALDDRLAKAEASGDEDGAGEAGFGVDGEGDAGTGQVGAHHALDPDREGEAIAYHIALQLGYEKDDGRKFKRVTFNEITREAVQKAIQHPGEIDVRRVDAQQARRILDRLVGYGLSPLLWKKISPVDPISRKPLSAGRVQSVAVRQTVERERARRAFRTAGLRRRMASI